MAIVRAFFKLPLRTRFGICAFVLLGATALSYVPHMLGMTKIPPKGWLLSTGSILFLIWLAWDHLAAIPHWFWVMMPVLLIVGAIRPILLLIVVPALFLGFYSWSIHKKKKKRRKNMRASPDEKQLPSP